MFQNKNEDIILGHGQLFDLRSVPFSRRGSFVCIIEDPEDRSLYLSITRSPDMWMQRRNLIRITPVIDNKELPYEYDVQPGKLTIRTFCGTAELCFDDKKYLRIRGKGVHLRLSFPMMLFENCSPTENGELEAVYNMLGKLLFVPLKGAMFSDARWVPEKSRADDFILEFLPSVETGIFEVAVHEYYSNGIRDNEYQQFDDCVRTSENDFYLFCKRFSKVPEEYKDTARLAAWTIWSHSIGPARQLRHEVVYMTRTAWLRAFSWEQSFQAMAAGNDISEALKLLLTMFDYQNAAGQLPDSAGDNEISYMVTKPPIQGFALNYIMRHCSFDELPQEKCAELYNCLCKLAVWWLTKRDRNHSGVPQYYHADESGWSDTSLFKKGVPLQSPDLISMLILLTEVCGTLATFAGASQKESTDWIEESKRLLTVLIQRFWDGRQFTARLAADGGNVDSASTVTFIPIILGRRLPREITEIIAARLMNEEEYLTPGGIASESLKSIYFSDAEECFARGSLIGALQALLVIGLEDAGHVKEAETIASRWCSLCREEGFSVKLEPFSNAASQYRYKQENVWTSWSGACFLMLAAHLQGEHDQMQKEERSHE